MDVVGVLPLVDTKNELDMASGISDDVTDTEKDVWATEDGRADAEGGRKTIMYSVCVTTALVLSATPGGKYVRK